MDESPSRPIVPFNNPELVVLRNPVARAKFGLSLVQSKILFEIIAYLKTRPSENFMTINVGDLLDKIGVETKRVKYYVDEIEEMTKKHLRIPEGDNEEGINYLAVNLLAGARFRIDKDGRGAIDIEISSMLKPYYLEIAKGDFFSYHILNTRVLKSTYSVKLYLLLKSYKRFGKLEIGLDELKSVLELSVSDYKQFPDFKKRVLERARTEIMEKNDIFFTYDEIRQFPRNSKSPVTRIIFHIRDNPDHKERVARLGEAKQARRVAKRAGAEEIETQVQIQNQKATRTDLGAGEDSTQTDLGVAESGPFSLVAAGKKAGSRPKSIKKVAADRVGEGGTQTDLGLEKISNTTSLGAGSEQKELLSLFRNFDKAATDEFILDYANGTGFDHEAILDALLYAKKQGGVRNIFAYLPTILRGGAGRGMAAKTRQLAQKAADAAARAERLNALKAEIEGVFEEAEAVKRDIVRAIVAEDEGATRRVVEQVKLKFLGSFGITEGMRVDEFREKPLLRSLVLHEFRVQFPECFNGDAGLISLEKKLNGLKGQARRIDPRFSV